MLIFKSSQVIKYYVMFAFLFVQTVPQISATLVWQDKTSGKNLSGFMVYKMETSMHYDEANDLTFCIVAYKDDKLNSDNIDKAIFELGGC